MEATLLTTSRNKGWGWIQNDYVGAGCRQEAHLRRDSRDGKHFSCQVARRQCGPKAPSCCPWRTSSPTTPSRAPKEEPSKRSTHPCPALNIQTCLNTDHEGPPKKRQPHIRVAQGLLQNQIQGLISLGMLNVPQGIPACSQGAVES